MPTRSSSLWLRSSLLSDAGFPTHGFTTKSGGVSEGPFASWNFSTSTGDAGATVEENYLRLATAIGAKRESIASVHQIHSVRVVVLETNDQETRTEKADALLTSIQDAVVAIKTADCVPILMADPVTGVVAAIHAGWRGVVGEIVPEVLSLLQKINPECQPLWAIGPHICRNCFQVGSEVAREFPSHSRPDSSTDGKFLVDLRAAVTNQLLLLGVSSDSIDQVDACTVCDPEQRFFSHRGSGGLCGRMLNFIGRT